ncbi:MAG: hypothetical protein KatS3mg111_1052 [Pirellulaceae bacterium]|nr:MAG: hypothetical protein KatS3mg111_1052 [Pirellulaceae bacterium]
MSSNPSPKSFPDLYRLLNLDPLEGDPARIRAAMQRVAARAKKESGTSGQRLQRLLALAQRHLLDAHHKAAYDKRWRKVYGDRLNGDSGVSTPTVAVAATASSPAGSVLDDALRDYLPAGDPAAPFDLQVYLQSAPSEVATATQWEQEYEQLMAIVSSSVHEQPTQAAPSAVAPALGAALVGDRPADFTSQASASRSTTFPSRASSTTLAKKLRKRRDRSLLLAAAGMLVTVAVVLGVLFAVLRMKEQQKEEAAQQLAQNPPTTPRTATAAPPDANNNLPRRRSGLAAVPGLATMADEAGATESPSGSQAMSADQDGNRSPSPRPSETDPGLAMSSPMAMQPPAGEESTASNSAENAPQQAPAMQPVVTVADLSAEEKAAWKKTMDDVRDLLRANKYDQAEQRLVEAERLAKTEPQQAQLARLQAAAKLAADCHRAILAAINQLGAGEVFTAGVSTPVSFVERGPDFIVVRVFGENKRYRLDGLPVGVGFGLADLQMDVAQPVSLARKAAWVVFHPQANDAAVRRAREMMQQAQAAGAVRDDMMLIFDDYTL